jgi:hypothetical protein
MGGGGGVCNNMHSNYYAEGGCVFFFFFFLPLSMEKEKNVIRFIVKHASVSTEYIRSNKFFDLEISDTYKNSIVTIPGYKVSLKKVFCGENSVNILDKIDLLHGIDKNPEGLSVRSIIDSYQGIKNDLMELTKQNDKNRKFLVVENDFLYDFIIWPFDKRHYLQANQAVILGWHSINRK